MPNNGPNATVTPHYLLQADSTDGYQIGSSAATPVGFYGTPGTPQRSNPYQYPIAYGLGTATLYTINSVALTPAGVGVNTTLSENLTCTGAPTVASDYVFCVNKPSAQAGLGIGNWRHSAVSSAVPIIQYVNLTGSTITPTASESYIVCMIRGFSATTTISPPSIPANTTFEFQTPVPGILGGSVIQVSKPTDQVGLGIAGCRVVANNVLGITFINTTGSAIVPTPNEPYQYASGNGIDQSTNNILVGINVGVLTGTTPNTTSEQTITVSGIQPTDIPQGVAKPTFQAGLGIVGYRVTTANAIGLTFGNWTASGVTPTASEVYATEMYRVSVSSLATVTYITLAPTSVAANTTAEQTFTLTGVQANSAMCVNKPSFQAGLGILGCRVSGLNSIAITYANATVSALTPSTEVYTITTFNNNFGGAGCYTGQQLVTGSLINAYLTNEIRQSLVNTGLIVGS